MSKLVICFLKDKVKEKPILKSSVETISSFYKSINKSEEIKKITEMQN